MNSGVVLTGFLLLKKHRMNKKLYRIILTLACSVFSNNLVAGALTESQVLSSVTQHYPLVQAATANIQKARAEYLASKGRFDPKINSQLIGSPNNFYRNIYSDTELNIPVTDSGNSFFTGYRIGRGNFPVYNQERETYNNGEIKAGIELPLLRDKNIDIGRAKIKQSRIRTALNQAELKLVRLEANQAATIAYWDWYAEGKKLLLQQQLLDLANVRQRALEGSFNAGDVANIEVVDNKRIILQRKNALTLQEAIFQKASLTLALFYRDAKGNPIAAGIDALPKQSQPASNYNLTAINEHYDLRILEHPAVKRLNEQRKLTYVDLESAHNKLLPKLNNRIYFSQDFGGGNPPLNRTSINYQLVFELPILQREAKGEILAATHMINKINEEERMQHDNLVRILKDSINQIKAQQTIINSVGEEIKMAVQVQKAENIRFQNGDSNLFLLNQREIETVQTQIRYVDSIGNYHKAIAALRFAMDLNQ